MSQLGNNRIVWDREKCNRLQDFYATKPKDSSPFFSEQVGKGVINFAEYFVKEYKSKKCLDYGCGEGTLISYMISKGATCYGVDMAPELVGIVNMKFENNPCWGGIKLFEGKGIPYDNDFFDLITCTEVIEHILPQDMDMILRELYRVLKPGGILLITTPNDEDFRYNEICCPECNTVFHMYGHIHRFDKNTLAKMMGELSYKTIMCGGTNFNLFQKKHVRFINLCLKDIKNSIINSFDSIRDTHSYTGKVFRSKINVKNKDQHLFWVGTK